MNRSRCPEWAGIVVQILTSSLITSLISGLHITMVAIQVGSTLAQNWQGPIDVHRCLVPYDRWSTSGNDIRLGEVRNKVYYIVIVYLSPGSLIRHGFILLRVSEVSPGEYRPPFQMTALSVPRE